MLSYHAFVLWHILIYLRVTLFCTTGWAVHYFVQKLEWNRCFFSLFHYSNKLLSVTSTQTKIVPSMVEDRTDSTECNPIFPGMNYCTILRYSNASSTNNAPYYPLTGETRWETGGCRVYKQLTSQVYALKNKQFLSRLALELQPTGEVPEYTANIAYALLREGKEGRHKVDSVKIVLKAEGKSSNYFNDITNFLFYF